MTNQTAVFLNFQLRQKRQTCKKIGLIFLFCLHICESVSQCTDVTSSHKAWAEVIQAGWAATVQRPSKYKSGPLVVWPDAGLDWVSSMTKHITKNSGLDRTASQPAASPPVQWTPQGLLHCSAPLTVTYLIVTFITHYTPHPVTGQHIRIYDGKLW